VVATRSHEGSFLGFDPLTASADADQRGPGEQSDVATRALVSLVGDMSSMTNPPLTSTPAEVATDNAEYHGDSTVPIESRAGPVEPKRSLKLRSSARPRWVTSVGIG
jgi:hypothetical protein